MEKIPLFLKLQSKAIAMYSGVTKNVMDNETIITQSSTTTTTINPFRQCPVTPSRRPPPRAPPKTRRARRKNYLLNLQKPTSQFELFRDVKFLRQFFSVFSPIDRCVLAQVCLKWKDVLYSDPGFWKGLLPVIYYNDLRRIPDKPNLDHLNTNCISYHLRTKLRTQESNESNDSTRSDSSFDDAYNGHPTSVRASLYASIEKRGFDCICLYSATDADVFDFASRVSPSTLRIINFGAIRCSTITDKGLDIFLASLSQSLRRLEIIGCNEISDSGLWTSLVPHLNNLTIRDCINVGDETIAATSQMLPELRELCLQTYHMSDASTTFFSAVTIRGKLRAIRLENCWEMTNQGVLNICSSLPYVERLSLLGCSKITDDCVELISENLKNLKALDISWCNRITDVGIESIACDFALTLEELIIDRCQGVSDHSMSFVSVMPNLHTFTFRWCTNISDYGLQILCTSKAVKVLSLAGCPLVTASGLRHIKAMTQLEEVELTNVPAASPEIIEELKLGLPDCEIIF